MSSSPYLTESGRPYHVHNFRVQHTLINFTLWLFVTAKVHLINYSKKADEKSRGGTGLGWIMWLNVVVATQKRGLQLQCLCKQQSLITYSSLFSDFVVNTPNQYNCNPKNEEKQHILRRVSAVGHGHLRLKMADLVQKMSNLFGISTSNFFIWSWCAGQNFRGFGNKRCRVTHWSYSLRWVCFWLCTNAACSNCKKSKIAGPVVAYYRPRHTSGQVRGFPTCSLT